MAVQATPPGEIPYDSGAVGRGYDDDRGYGWVLFAGTLLILLSILNFIEGIAAIGNSHFFVNNAHYIAGSLNTWGWIVMLVGIVEFFVGLGVFLKNQFSRWTGVAILGLNAIAQLMFIPAYPFWSLSVFTLDIIAMFALVAYGGRISSAG